METRRGKWKRVRNGKEREGKEKETQRIEAMWRRDEGGGRG